MTNKPTERQWQPWERNYSGNRVGVQEQQGEHENWMILHIESGGAKTTTSLKFGEAWDLATRLSPPLAARMDDLFKKMRKAQDAMHQFTWADTIAPLLRKVADDWDCDSSQCEFASDDMGGLSCPCMEDERGCRAVEANEMRQFAEALEVAAVLRSSTPQEPDDDDDAECLLELERLVLWELPRSHKGFRCQWEHDHIRRAFERARQMLASGQVHQHRCGCAGCKSDRLKAKAPETGEKP